MTTVIALEAGADGILAFPSLGAEILGGLCGLAAEWAKSCFRLRFCGVLWVLRVWQNA